MSEEEYTRADREEHRFRLRKLLERAQQREQDEKDRETNAKIADIVGPRHAKPRNKHRRDK